MGKLSEIAHDIDQLPKDGWRDIESAPKDGTLVLISERAAGGASVTAALWDDDDKNWWELNNHHTDYWGEPCNPTKWQPLPPPPEGE